MDGWMDVCRHISKVCGPVIKTVQPYQCGGLLFLGWPGGAVLHGDFESISHEQRPAAAQRPLML